jgi:pyrimidine deaminase RibD-like protein
MSKRTDSAQRDIDAGHMERCLDLAEAYRGRTSPNPMVGCVIVDRAGKVIAEGAHRGPGTHHAEVVALRKLKGKAPGATLYVNLEPCNHHGRTPPCAPVVRDAGVARVVIGLADPIAEHAGGIALLRRARIKVKTGVLADECARVNRAFLSWAERRRPMYTLKAAITLDGKIATISGQSKWLTGPLARADVMRLRDQHDAVMVGIGTVLADDPWLTARILTSARRPPRTSCPSGPGRARSWSAAPRRRLVARRRWSPGAPRSGGSIPTAMAASICTRWAGGSPISGSRRSSWRAAARSMPTCSSAAWPTSW